MPDPVSNSPQGNGASFASLLAALTGTGKEPAEPWDTSALGEDVATISYEQALRTHRRVRTDANDPQSIVSNPPAPAGPEKSKKAPKTVSVTIRVTEDEGQQLHARAKEAGLSVSGYLRSCIFEAETLRAQVKEALAKIREATLRENHISEAEPLIKAPQRRFRLFPRWTHHRVTEG
jgi:hypothetical protein